MAGQVLGLLQQQGHVRAQLVQARKERLTGLRNPFAQLLQLLDGAVKSSASHWCIRRSVLHLIVVVGRKGTGGAQIAFWISARCASASTPAALERAAARCSA